MIIALAGRRIDEDQTDTPRFPLQNVSPVRKKIKDLFKKKNAKALVCGAACGADLIALDVAEELGLRQRIVLSSEPEEYRENSVTDRAGNWGEKFDKVYRRLKATRDVVVLKSTAKDDEVYLEANKKIFQEAIFVAENYFNVSDRRDVRADPSEKVIAVIVWEGESRGKNDITADFAETGRNYGFDVVEIITK